MPRCLEVEEHERENEMVVFGSGLNAVGRSLPVESRAGAVLVRCEKVRDEEVESVMRGWIC